MEQFIEKQNKIDKPILSDDQLAELNDKLAYKMFNNPETKVKYYSRGYIEMLNGFVHKTDALKGVLVLNTKGEDIEIPLTDIVYIE
ncbi:YolD-like family protein [Staphylococcus lloydii]|uniref:YolD-like family protein n=1 Tax=Staphylococcus lloydii TaxID=2781774 RepID=UPI002929C0B4|nr:YolD-like family protein [Staphylococcus lloydii]MDU9419032.1 YolD-like family protein [Staphylococcus lloydii]